MSHTDTNHEPAPLGAVERLARDDVERKQFLRMAGRKMGGAAAATGLAAFIAACGSSTSKSPSTSTGAPASSGGPASTTGGTSTGGASTKTDSGDLAIVNYALTLEYLESQFYRKVIASGLFHGTTLSVLKSFGSDEDAHVVALKSVASSLGTAAMEPTGKFPITSAAQVTQLAGTVENLGASAYLGQAGRIQSKEILAAALSIHTVEARHAATLNTLLKLSPTPQGAFAVPLSMDQVLAAVKPFIA